MEFSICSPNQIREEKTSLGSSQVCEFIIPRRRHRTRIDQGNLREATNAPTRLPDGLFLEGKAYTQCAIWEPATMNLGITGRSKDPYCPPSPVEVPTRTDHLVPTYVSPMINYPLHGADATFETYPRLSARQLSPSAPQVSPKLHTTVDHQPAPDLLIEYIKTLRIELWIDQEGHRTIRPRFSFKREVSRHSFASNSLKTRLDTGSRRSRSPVTDRLQNSVGRTNLVDLRPSVKAVGTFHCGVCTQSI
jgi:hypothetical protein